MADPVFYGLATLTVGSAIIALETKELIYGAIALAISMLGIAGFFILLDSPFVAMFQITVYVGAVAVLVIFTVMLVRTQSLFTIKDDKGRKIAAIIMSLIMIIGLGAILWHTDFGNTVGKGESNAIDFIAIGESMLTYYSPVLILLGLTLAGSIIGALSLARREKEVSQ
jgi:NADH:ubiquinone oxidoreductase subunit 6 (subunit J)